MTDSDRALLAYLNLAALSAEKRQRPGQDRFLILAGAAACQAGLVTIAERCRQLVLAGNPRHMIGGYDSFPEAMRNAEFQPFLKQLKRLCPPEQAEHLLQKNGTDLQTSNTGSITEAEVNSLLDRIASLE